MKRFLFIFLSLLFSLNAQAGQKVDEILKRIDQNQANYKMKIESSMTIHGSRGSRTLTSRSFILNKETAFTEYLSPAREQGTKMLKKGDKLWLYSPKADRTITIAGHMLRQPMMGSDLNYEDMMSKASLLDDYQGSLLKEEKIEGRNHWVIELKAKRKDIAYPKRVIWGDQQYYLSKKDELYALSGKLIKRVSYLEFMKTNKGWYPKRMIFKDLLKTGKGTEFLILKLEFDPKFSSRQFTKGALRR